MPSRSVYKPPSEKVHEAELQLHPNRTAGPPCGLGGRLGGRSDSLRVGHR